MKQLAGDFRYALRRLARRPGFTAAGIVTLALGIGMTTAIFSMVDASLLRSLPFPDSSRLVFLQGYAASPDGPNVRGAAPAEIDDWRRLNRSFSEVLVVDGSSFTLAGTEAAERVPGEFVSPGYFEMLGAAPLAGRVFERREAAGTPVSEAVISEGLWERRFGRSRDILGTTIRLNDTAMTVVGVMPSSFAGVTFNAEVWAPESAMWLLGAPGAPDSRGTRWLIPLARLADGVSLEAARADMDSVAARLAERHPETNTDRGALVTPLREVYLDGSDSLVWALFGAVGLLMVIACANIANLYLVRASGQRHELVLRAALGARRRQLVRLYLAESLLLAALGAAFGMLLAALGIQALSTFAPDGLLPPYAQIALDWRCLAVATGLALAAGTVAGVAPALLGYRADVAEGIKGGARAATSREGAGFRQALVVTEIALALTVAAAAILMMRSFQNQLAVEPGFDAGRVLAFRLELPEAGYERDRLAPFARELTASLQSVPGVQSVSLGSSLPLRDRASANFVALPDRPEQNIRVYRHHVTPGYFRALGIPLKSGRDFDAEGGEAPVTIVSESFARRFFPDRDAVGQVLQAGPGLRLNVVGVAADVRYRDLTSDLVAGQDDPDFYLPYTMFPDRSFDVAVRTHLDPASLAEPVRAAVARLDPGLAVFDMAPLSLPLAAQTAQARFGTTLLGAFSLTAILLASVGIYGLMSFMVAERSREFAIRMAAGAPPPAIRRLVLGRSLLLALLGIPVGIAGAVAISRVMAAQLFGVSGLDPIAHGAALLLLLVAVALSVWWPASRAARTDLAKSLRYE